jgi:glycosyltransferase involved in cell wall biosynthesis
MHIGNFLHKPNLDAVHQLKREIWPELRSQLPDARLFIYGPYAPQAVQEMHDEHSAFIVAGTADDLEEVYSNHRVLLAPLRFGAGLKGKVFDAMTYGMPAVMTPIAAEGLFRNLDSKGFVLDMNHDFVRKAAQLYQDEQLWEQSRSNGFKVLEKRFQKSAFAKALPEKIDEIKRNPIRPDFNQHMLNYHSHNALKFKSRWIGLKESMQ